MSINLQKLAQWSTIIDGHTTILYESRFSGKPLNVSPFQWNNLHICISVIFAYSSNITNCWVSHDVTKLQTKKLSFLPSFYFRDALEQLKTNFHTNFRFKRVLGFVIEYAWISKLLRDAVFTSRPRELSCRLKKWLISENFAN